MEGESNNEQPLLLSSGDIPAIDGVASFVRESGKEMKKLWFLAGPTVFTLISQFSIKSVAQIFAGQLSSLELAAVSVQSCVIGGFAWGTMLGMGSAAETLCGQAFGAGQVEMLGIYMQRSCIIMTATAVLLTPLFIFAEPVLLLIGQSPEISAATGRFALLMVPEAFAYALNFPVSRFLQAQSKVTAMALISVAGTAMNALLCWLLMIRLRWGLAGAAVAVNSSWWFIVLAQFLYVCSGACGRAWSGFSLKAFHNLWGYVKLSLASAFMLCMEVWYYTVLIIFAGYFKNAQVSVDALSICLNILGWSITVSMGMNAAISVRVSNELGAAHPRTAKFSVVIATINTFLIGVVLSLILIFKRDEYPILFSNDVAVENLVGRLTPLLALCIVINSIQPVLSGVAVGAGWQAAVAYVNVICYYLFGVPLGLMFGYKLKMGVTGLWLGMVIGTVVQTIVLLLMIYRTNWTKEASVVGDRIKKWGGQVDSIETTQE